MTMVMVAVMVGGEHLDWAVFQPRHLDTPVGCLAGGDGVCMCVCVCV